MYDRAGLGTGLPVSDYPLLHFLEETREAADVLPIILVSF